MTRVEELLSQIKKLKTEKNAIILGHNYMEYSVQLVSDFTGDSYDLAVKAMKTNAKIIIFAGVYFMAEQASFTIKRCNSRVELNKLHI